MISNLRFKPKVNKQEDLKTQNRRLKTQISLLQINKKQSCDKPKPHKIKIISNKIKQPLQEINQISIKNLTITLKKEQLSKEGNKKQTGLTKVNMNQLKTQSNCRQRFSYDKKKLINNIFNKDKESINNTKILKKQTQNLDGQQRYIIQTRAGSGTFGVVHKARDKQTLEFVAIKKVYQDKQYKNRQLQILKQLNHPNVVKMKDSYFTYQGNKQYLNVVMDYYPYNLGEYILKHKLKGEISAIKIKLFAYQLFKGLLYLQNANIAHRDIKPHNILVNDQSGKLIICDFGSAKKIEKGEGNLAYICSRSYRAPELIFGSTNYSTHIDVWSAGCILAQMVTKQPIFKSNSSIDQLVEIIKIIGTPSIQQIFDMNPKCDIQKFKLPTIAGMTLEKFFVKKIVSPQFLNLIKKILCYSPKKRITPQEALNHPYFNELHEENISLKLKDLSTILNFTNFKDKQSRKGQVSSCQYKKI